MMLREWNPRETIDEVDLSMVEFFIQIHGLPLEIVDEENGRLIGCKLMWWMLLKHINRLFDSRFDFHPPLPWDRVSILQGMREWRYGLDSSMDACLVFVFTVAL